MRAPRRSRFSQLNVSPSTDTRQSIHEHHQTHLEKIKRLDSLGELYELFGELLPDRLLSMSEEGPNSRDRVSEGDLLRLCLPSARCGQRVPGWRAQKPALSEAEWVEAGWRWMQKDRTGEPALSSSAYCQARARLDMQTLRLIHGHLAWSLDRRVQSQQLWLGRRVKILRHAQARWHHPL